MGVFGVFGTVSGAEKRGDEEAKITFQKKKDEKREKNRNFVEKVKITRKIFLLRFPIWSDPMHK